MDPMATWEKVLLGILAVALIFLFRPGLKAAMERSREAEKDWPAVIVPLVLVLLFVLLLVSLV